MRQMQEAASEGTEGMESWGEGRGGGMKWDEEEEEEEDCILILA